MQNTSPFVPIVGFAASVSLLALLYYEKKRKLEEAIIDNVGDDSSDVDCGLHVTDDLLDSGGEPENTEHVNEVVVDVKASPSLTGYSSFEDEDMEKTCQATDSSTSAYSTASEDNGPFPVGEFSTYKRHQGDTDLNHLDLHALLDSPVVEDHFNDERMNRSPIHHCDELAQYYNNADTNSPSAQVNSIVAAYNDIVPPLRPNTGEIIHSPNRSKVR